jgi:hypothetical protein
MKRAAKILLWIFGSLLAAFIVFNGVYYLANYNKIRQEAVDLQACNNHFAEVQHDLPLGTPRDQVLRYLKAHGQDEGPRIGQADEIYVNLGRVKSESLVCDYFDYYAEFSFTFDTSPGSLRRNLAHITKGSSGHCL